MLPLYSQQFKVTNRFQKSHTKFTENSQSNRNTANHSLVCKVKALNSFQCYQKFEQLKFPVIVLTVK